MKKLFLPRARSQKHKGQGFVELMLIIPALALMLAGVVEFGMLLNNYLKVLDGTREGARLASQMIAFYPNPSPPPSYMIDEKFFLITAAKSLSTMTPIDLNGNRGDDLLISVMSMVGTTTSLRFPNYNTAWSLCDNYAAALGDPTDFRSFLTSDQYDAFVNGWNTCSEKPTKVPDAEIQARMVSNAFDSGIVLVEAYYNYPQMLKLPVIEQIGDPIPVYAYSFMPMSSAMPTPTLP